MIDRKNDFVRLLSDLCYLYKDYVSDNDGTRLDVVIGNNIIKMYLYNSSIMVDELDKTKKCLYLVPPGKNKLSFYNMGYKLIKQKVFNKK